MTTQQTIEQKKILTTAHYDYEKGLNVHAFFKTHSHTISKDLVQDTFTKTWKYLAKGGKIDMMKAFLYHVLNNLIVDQYRKRKTTSLDILLEKGFEPIADNDSPERSSNVLEGKAVFLLIKNLPKKYQKVMSMRYIQDLSLKEISSKTGQTKNAVAVQTHRGLIKLKSLYDLSQIAHKSCE